MLYQNPEMGTIAPVYVFSGQLGEMYRGEKNCQKTF